MKSNYKKLGKNTLIFALGSFTQKAMAFLLVPFIHMYCLRPIMERRI